MTLPFSHDAFLDVFGAYNASLWPLAGALWGITAAVALAWLSGRLGGRQLLLLLAAHWVLSGVAYHWLFFRDINPAAALFAVMFVLQGCLFVWLGLIARPALTALAWRRWIGIALTVYGLAYPLVNLAFGLRYPRVPLFAVPCPTTLVTAGLLLTCAHVSRAANLVPAAWAVVGCSAAFVLGIRADLALAVAAGVLVIDMLLPSSVRAGGAPRVRAA